MTTAIAYSYIRWSSSQQGDGDSFRRQTDGGAADWCRRNKVTLDTKMPFLDAGKSAFKGVHRSDPDRYALASFLDMVKRGRIPKGAYLIVENMDRLTREAPVEAGGLIFDLLRAGIRIVQLKPSEIVFDYQSGHMALFMALMEQGRGHSESKMKSERVGAAWENKRKAAREGRNQPPRRNSGRITTSITDKLPSWVEDRDGLLVLIPNKAAAVRRIYELSAAGYGTRAIVRRLAEEGVQPIGRSAFWNPPYIWNLLNDRRAVGELQPRKAGQPDGPPIAGYFPAVVSEETYAAARAASSRRNKRPGRPSYHTNVFAGLLKNARDGGSYFATTRSSRGKRSRILVTSSGTQGRSSQFGFPFEVFEAAVLSALSEIDPSEVLGQEEGPDEVRSLSDQLTALESRLAAIQDQMVEGEGDVAVLTGAARRLEERTRLVVEKLAEARAKAAHPLSEAWGETQSLTAALRSDDTRIRLQAALRRVIESIYILVIPQGLSRHAIVQVFFKGSDKSRLYVISYQAVHGPSGRPSTWEANASTTTLGADLRDRTTWGKWWWGLLV